jgi:hypothetical protein
MSNRKRRKETTKAPVLMMEGVNFYKASDYETVGKVCVDLDTTTGDVFVSTITKSGLPKRKTTPWVRLVLDLHQLQGLANALADSVEVIRERSDA